MSGIKSWIKNRIYHVRFFPLFNRIVFESSPNFACNTYPVFCYMKEHYPNFGYVWALAQTDNFIVPEGIDDWYYYDAKGIKQKWKRFYYSWTSKALISCNRIQRKHTISQLSVFLGHGSKTKKTRGVYEVGSGVDYVNVQSHFFDDIITYEYNCPRKSLVYLGYPRCDYLFNPRMEIVCNTLFPDGQKDYVIWLPTLRKYRTNCDDDSRTSRKDVSDGIYDHTGIPLIYSVEALQELDAFLGTINCRIVFKPHPVQDIRSLARVKLKNILIITDTFLNKNGLQLYEVIACSKALITDYSSVFFDYLLINRPIATTMDDIESWKQNRGFAFDIESMYNSATVRIAKYEELKSFLADVIRGKDDHVLEREKICTQCNQHMDGEASQRVAEFIMSHIKQ